MNFAAIRHKATDVECYARNSEELVIQLFTGYDIDKVFLISGDPFEFGILGGSHKWQGKRSEITQKRRLKNHLLWKTIVSPKFKRCRYYFEIHSGDEVYFMLEDGFYKSIDDLPGMLEGFTFPWMNPIDIYTPPKWVQDTVWYQIFPDRFCRVLSQDEINAKKLPEWHEDKPVKKEIIYGGNLAGIISRLDYLKDLGISGIYLNPVNQSSTSHKYDTVDYLEIDSFLGDKETMKQLVSEAHKRGIRIMLDGVFNHSGWLFPQWKDVEKKGPASPYYSWFMVNEWPFDKPGNNARNGKFYSFAFVDGMPKLNTNNQEVIDYLLDVCEKWVNDYDIDALRLDVANEVSHNFCRQLRQRMLKLKKDFYIIGEIWHDSTTWLRGDEFDAVMNYPLANSLTNFWLDKKQTSLDFECAINRCYSMYMEQISQVLFNLLDSHDTIRLVTKLENVDWFYQQMAVLFTMPGSSCIYYGTEIVMEGGFDPDCRRCMPWSKIDSGKYDDKISAMKQLIKMRNENELCKSLEIRFMQDGKNPRFVHYQKIADNGVLDVRLNCSENIETLTISEEVLFSRLYDGEQLQPGGVVISYRKN